MSPKEKEKFRWRFAGQFAVRFLDFYDEKGGARKTPDFSKAISYANALIAELERVEPVFERGKE